MRWNVIFIADRQFFESCSSSDDAVVWYYLKRKVILNCHRPMYSFSVFVLSFLLWTIKTTHNIFIIILNGIVMEKTTPLNGPTTTGQSWKETKAKGFGLLIMFTTLLLGLALLWPLPWCRIRVLLQIGARRFVPAPKLTALMTSFLALGKTPSVISRPRHVLRQALLALERVWQEQRKAPVPTIGSMSIGSINACPAKNVSGHK